MNPIFAKENFPPPFPAGEPAFVAELKQHHPFVPRRNDAAPAVPGALPLLPGVCFLAEYPDPAGRLATAYSDFRRFLKEAGIPEGSGAALQLVPEPALPGEDFLLTVSAAGITLKAGTTEGIRRGLYRLMDRIAALQTPWLLYGEEKKHYWLKNRITRCFFGPIKRPPFNVDELMNDIDYYPDEYLSRLAREGINGLWLSVSFRELCSTSFTKGSPDAPRRIAKLRKTVEQCLRYGIKTWIFCIEPTRWCPMDNPLPPGHEEMQGPGYGASLTAGYAGGMRSFCPRSPEAQRYLYESTYAIFSQVPGLGGQLTISHGERLTSCLSTLSTASRKGKVNCTRECDWTPADIISHTLGPMAKGMHDANPDAELISWLYQPDEEQVMDWVYHLPDKLTREVNLAYNLESGVSKRQLGKLHVGGDYWLSCAGPSDRFYRIAQATKGHCGLAAKLQVACSHEVATVPDLPVPGLLYEKYRAMHVLGVEHAVQCWYFGNYPGVMNRASGMLACEDFTTDAEEFLARLAAPEWPGCGEKIAEAWLKFQDSYQNYPLNKLFQYYGPVHDGPVWPLHLKQVRRQLPRTWQSDNMPAGDALGESLKDHTVGEVSILLSRMSSLWQQGLRVMESFAGDFADSAECRDQLSAARALGIQFASAANIFRFYVMRAALFGGAREPLALLESMEKLVREEIENSRKLCALCETDSRLGYHSEAEVFKYYPAKLQWRIRILQEIVLKDFAECRKALAAGQSFAEFARCRETVPCRTGVRYENGRMSWLAECSAEELKVTVDLADPTDAEEEFLKFYLMDESCNEPPITVNTAIARRSTECVDWSESASLAKEETGAGWRVTVRFPRCLFGGKTAVLFGIELLEYRGDKMANLIWPAGEYPDTLRVALNYFTPDRMGLLEL